MRRLLLLPLVLCLRLAAQTPTKASAPPQPEATPQLSPQAAYDQASTPIDITHRVFANWSDIEKNALYVAIAQADDACLARKSETYTGDDLIAYARLCDLGEEWPSVYTAATLYINSNDPKPQLALAYAFEVKADLKLNHEKAAAGACLAMLHSVPYGPIPDEVTSTTIRYLQFAYTSEALTLHAQRQPFLLDLLRTAQPPGSTSVPPSPASTPSVPLHTIFEHALDFAALEQYTNQPRLAAAILSDIDQAMPSTLPPDEAIFIAADRRQYALLGTHFPALPGAISLLPAKENPPTQPNFGSATFFFLFPPWCAQCIRQAQDLIPSMVRTGLLTGSDKIHVYALLADTPPPPPAPPAKPSPPATVHHPATNEATKPPATPASSASATPAPPPTAAEQLRKTPTLVVAPSTLADFNAADFPFLIATDHDGIIRLLVPAAPDNALVQNGAIDQITATLLANWPPPPAKP